MLGRGTDAYRLAGFGAVVGLLAFTVLILSAPLGSPPLFAAGVALIGFGGGLFAHCTLTAAMGQARGGQVGLALGIWGAVQASAAGGAIGVSGFIRDGVAQLAARGALGPALDDPATGYGCIYAVEIVLLFATLAAVGPLVRATAPSLRAGGRSLRVAELPL
jgi:BCD family chlorophyll transporter-like MFS transporter